MQLSNHFSLVNIKLDNDATSP